VLKCSVLKIVEKGLRLECFLIACLVRTNVIGDLVYIGQRDAPFVKAKTSEGGIGKEGGGIYSFSSSFALLAISRS
jgi:hypothetical protein